MLQQILALLGGALGKELLGAIKKWLKEMAERRKIKKAVNSKVKDIMNEKDAQTRAKRMHDLLNN